MEWAKSYCRAMRFTEEVQLIQEEMHRTLRFLSWKANDWESCTQGSDLPPEDLRDGLSAYASHQAQVYRRLAEHFTTLWAGVPHYVQQLNKRLQETGSSLYRDMEVKFVEIDI